MKKDAITIHTKKVIPLERISNLLCSAFDPVSHAVSYWCEISGRQKPENYDNFRTDEKEIYYYMDFPLNQGGALFLKDVEEDNGETYELGLLEIEKGLQVMAEKYPKHFNDFIEENDDNDTADVFIQCCVLGDVIYG